jgi:acetyl-CoA carboxylase carboxyltransferase component
MWTVYLYISPAALEFSIAVFCQECLAGQSLWEDVLVTAVVSKKDEHRMGTDLKEAKSQQNQGSTKSSALEEQIARIKRGGAPKYHQKLKEDKKLFARERLALLLDPGFEIEDARFANGRETDLPADGVVTGIGQIEGKTVCFMANDSTVKAGSWGWRTVEKIIRIQETAAKLRVPLIYLVDSAGARITDQIEMFPGRRGAGKIFHNQVSMSGMIPQICLLFGPSAAGGAYIPAFCDIVVMVDGNASMYLGSPRMAEMVIGEKVTLEEMGGARMHCSVSGCGDVLAKSEEEAIQMCKDYLRFMPANCSERVSLLPSQEPVSGKRTLEEIIPEKESVPFDVYEAIDTIIDAGTFFEIKKLFASELVTGFARIGGRAVGILANQPKVKGGVLDNRLHRVSPNASTPLSFLNTKRSNVFETIHTMANAATRKRMVPIVTEFSPVSTILCDSSSVRRCIKYPIKSIDCLLTRSHSPLGDVLARFDSKLFRLTQ